MDVSAKELLGALKALRAACKPNKTYDILQCVRLEAAGGSLLLTAFNLDQQAEVRLSCEGDVGPLLVNSEDLSRWLAKTDQGKLATLTASADALSLKVGRASSKLPLADIKHWGSISEDGRVVSCIVAGPSFNKALSAASVAVFKDVSRPHLCGVSVETGSVRDARASGRLSLCGTNGVMLVAMDIAATGLEASGRTILAPECADAIQRFFGDAETLTLSWGERLVEVSASGRRLLSKLVAGTFPERWRGLGGTGRVPHVSYDNIALCAALASVATFAPEKGDQQALAVEITICDDKTELRSQLDHLVTSATDECPHSILNEPPKRFVTVGADQIIKISQALDAETIQLSIGAEHGVPVIITGAALDDRIALTVPLRDAFQQPETQAA